MNNLLISLDIMWKGMVGIFVVMIIIMLIVKLLGKIGSKKK